MSIIRKHVDFSSNEKWSMYEAHKACRDLAALLNKLRYDCDNTNMKQFKKNQLTVQKQYLLISKAARIVRRSCK